VRGVPFRFVIARSREAYVAAGDAQIGVAAHAPHLLSADGAIEPVLTPVASEYITQGAYLRYGKRIIDVTLGTALLLLALPLIALVALAVALTSGWPVFYRSSRTGMDGRPFQMWKFRTMVRDADAVSDRWRDTHPALAQEMATAWKLREDPRVTPLGGFLRRSSLDELPQFVNVLRGEMSLVGPRPYLCRESLDPALARSIVAVRPGLTGPFQVRGRNTLSPSQRQQLEAEYWRGVGLASDFGYLPHTLRPLMRLDGH
jgi:lipopolysaccharide/colanic/teichoic acid biosynthesis glycosyltransferase